MLNSDLLLEYSRYLAEYLATAVGDDVEAQIRLACSWPIRVYRTKRKSL